jgi:hypothetical protein
MDREIFAAIAAVIVRITSYQCCGVDDIVRQVGKA